VSRTLVLVFATIKTAAIGGQAQDESVRVQYSRSITSKLVQPRASARNQWYDSTRTHTQLQLTVLCNRASI
jgi:hypothetical protein